MPMTEATAALRELVHDLRARFPEHGIRSEIYVTAPGAEIAEDHELIRAIDESHQTVFGSPPERDVVRWYSDASVLSRYGIATVNYGTSSGLPDPEYGENLEIEGLVEISEVYARAAQRICG
jgi:acetylornithine deacetylase/succinyl-diaminopimelate desuccinylase-like protein